MTDIDADLSLFLQPFIDGFGHGKRRAMCPLYIAGLIGPGDRKSIEPMAARLAPGQYDRLHHFISDGIRDDGPLSLELALQADRMVGADDAFLVIDDTALPKKGEHFVGVAPQYASMLGKRANCQTLVSLTLACLRGGSRAGWTAAVPSGKLGGRSITVIEGRCARGNAGATHQA